MARLRRGRQQRPRRSTGSARSRRRPAARSPARPTAPPTRRSTWPRPATTTSSSPRATSPRAWSPSKEAAEVNTDLIPNYAKVYDFLKDKEWNTFDGKNYGVPHGYGANLLMYNERRGHARPRRRGPSVFERRVLDVPGQGDRLRLADLHRRRRALPDEHPARPRHREPLRARRGAVRRRGRPAQGAARATSGEYWSDYLKEISAFETGDSVIGTTWQVIANSVEKSNVKAFLPEEGSTGWSDTWMISSQAKNPNCAYAWLDYIESPEANAQATEYFGEAPNNQEACDFASDPSFCETYNAGDEDFAEQALVLAHAGRRVPRRSHRRRVHGLLGLDQGLDRDQGLTRPHVARHRPRGRPPPRGRPRGVSPRPWSPGRGPRLALLLAAPLTWLVLVYVVALAALLVIGAVDGRQLHRRDRPLADPRQPQGDRDRVALPHRHAAHPGRRGPGDGASTSSSRCRSRSTWPRSPRRARSGSW